MLLGVVAANCLLSVCSFVVVVVVGNGAFI